MVQVLGKWMSPLLLLTLILLIALAIIKAPTSIPEVAPNKAFITGFTTGYQTMDLFAAFFFSALIFSQIQQQLPEANPRELLVFAIKASLIGASLLALIYFGFVFLGAHYASQLQDITPELILPSIAQQAMGNQATLFMGVTMFFSCLTTAVALNNLYARYLCSFFKLKEQYFPLMLILTTGLAFVISLLDFKGIAAFLAPMLELTYPGIIALTLLTLVVRGRQRLKIAIFYGLTLMMCVPLLMHLS